jgi:hypothetical protein
MNNTQIQNRVTECLYSISECGYTVDHVRCPEAGRTVALRRTGPGLFEISCSNGRDITVLNDLNEDEVYEQVQKFMDALSPGRDLLVGTQFDYWANQGWRDAEVLATYKGLVLIAYIMPSGVVSMIVLEQDGRLKKAGSTGGYTGGYRDWWSHGETMARGYKYEAKRSVSLKGMPAYWRGAVTAEHGTLIENVLDSLCLEVD